MFHSKSSKELHRGTELQARPVWHWSYAALGPLLARDAVGNHTDQGTCTGGAGILGGVDRLETR